MSREAQRSARDAEGELPAGFFFKVADDGAVELHQGMHADDASEMRVRVRASEDGVVFKTFGDSVPATAITALLRKAGVRT